MRAAVLGSPVAHSLSPLLHLAAYAALNLPWRYDAVEVPAAALPGFLDDLDGDWVGLSLTMPLKQAVLPLLTGRSWLVELTGAANTVLLGDGRYGENTDVAGIVAAVGEVPDLEVERAVVLGAGATAASAVAALSQLGAGSVRLLARAPARAAHLLELAERLGLPLTVEPLDLVDGPAADVVISTTPAGALDSLAVSVVGRPPVLLDVVYAPWPTPLAAAYLAAGATVVPGSSMLLHQAAAQVELMTGRPAPLTAMRAALTGAAPAPAEAGAAAQGSRAPRRWDSMADRSPDVGRGQRNV